ncbi:hypothetical protein M406DRAFT_336152 [Cryphonectria parasitica EP155]|uniref:Zn(2)-C6 fungal-type domain-containing protein n=1 Tax=Cryphonectria parasitica (strain ATCC 38755 / EP155) TaxID=660469 RepID=A0A9P4YCR2_CRYP1|nr:uncharacterized protein M406DRAFT_336152 [Cryphonectria parasitica EP155]KAF3770487.1 hypothetical protein M406DRAFT_336152 [Cryphonectria parasitica EP155]
MDHETETKAKKGPRACITCAKAKSRCIPGPTKHICERCHRLNKPCSAQTPAPPRKRRAFKPTRVAELEKRLEDLTARVESGQAFPSHHHHHHYHQQQQQDRTDRTGPSGHEDMRTRQPSPTDTRRAPPAPQPRPDGTLQRATITPSGVSATPGSGIPKFYPDHEEGQRILENYGPHILTVFPFVVIPREITTSKQLLEQRPFLWKGVMMSHPFKDAKRQFLMGNDLLNDIITTTFVRPRKSIDLLQGLQLLIAWFHLNSDSFRVTNFLYLMRSICASLGFNESQRSLKQQRRDRTSLEYMRAFAGVYYLVTMAFTTNKMPDAFMSSNYVSQCCRVLEEKQEYPTDQLVVLLTRNQQLSQSISMALSFRDSVNSMPLNFIVNTFEREIEQFRASIPEMFQQHAVLITQVHVVKVLLYEVAVGEASSVTLLPTERCELLWKCLRAVRSLLEARFFVQPDTRPRSFCLASFDYTYGMLVALKLSTLDLPGWDLRVVRKELDSDKYLVLQIQELWELVMERNRRGLPIADGGGGGGGGEVEKNAAQQRRPSFQDPYKRLLSKIIQLRASIVADLAASMPAEPEESTTGTSFNALLGWGSDDPIGLAYPSWTGDVPI